MYKDDIPTAAELHAARQWRIAFAAFLFLLLALVLAMTTWADEQPCCSSDVCREQRHDCQHAEKQSFHYRVPERRFDTGIVARIHWTSAAFDLATTGSATRRCLDAWPGHTSCMERDRLARPFIGRYPRESWRLGLAWAGESVAVSYIPNRRLRRGAQIALIVSHVACGILNLKQWH